VNRVDLLVVGGGCNGAAVARDAAGRGLRVLLAERDDYAGATSSASSKLIHGGIRYLEHGAFGLVRESLHERETLLRIAPHLVSPLRFLLPVFDDAPRPAWKVRAGLALYDLLSGRRRLAASGRLARTDPAGAALRDPAHLRALLHYPDCLVDDARLVLATLLDARARGADVRNRCTVTALVPGEGAWVATLRTATGGATQVIARAVVNAAGPWADALLQAGPARPAADAPRLRRVRGSHLVLRAPPGASATDAWTLQHPDGRVIFVIPWRGGRLRILGTTDVPHDGDARGAVCTPAERDYLVAAHDRVFAQPIGRDDIVGDWSGVRALVDDGAAQAQRVTRESTLHVVVHAGAPLLSVLGGKLTTHRVLAEQVMAKLAPWFDRLAAAWTATAPVHGGELDVSALDALARAGPAQIPLATRQRWIRTYGSATRVLYDDLQRDPRGAAAVAPGVPRVELEHAVAREDVVSADDFLLRRTGLRWTLSAPERAVVGAWIDARTAAPVAA
jgi:glycerol-3-phosphate dehydrogenase